MLALAACGTDTSDTDPSAGGTTPAEEAAPVPPGQSTSDAPPAGDAPQGAYPGEPLVGPVETTASGLQYSILQPGNGEMPAQGENVSVHYTGYLMDGTVFDSSVTRGEPISFPLGTGMVVDGWDEGIALMSVGEKRKLIVPPELGYGAAGRPGIPGGATMVFDVELVAKGP
jgi:peptidylprolyl isomerase